MPDLVLLLLLLLNIVAWKVWLLFEEFSVFGVEIGVEIGVDEDGLVEDDGAGSAWLLATDSLLNSSSNIDGTTCNQLDWKDVTCVALRCLRCVRCVLRVVCCVLHVACCVLRVACCMLHVDGCVYIT